MAPVHVVLGQCRHALPSGFAKSAGARDVGVRAELRLSALGGESVRGVRTVPAIRGPHVELSGERLGMFRLRVHEVGFSASSRILQHRGAECR